MVVTALVVRVVRYRDRQWNWVTSAMVAVVAVLALLVPLAVPPPVAEPPLALKFALLLDRRDGRVVHEFALFAREDAATDRSEAPEDPEENEEEQDATDGWQDNDEDAVATVETVVVLAEAVETVVETICVSSN